MIELFSRHRDLARHFAGQSSPAGDRRLFRHMKACARCRDEYRTFAMLEALAPGGGDQARERLGRGLFEPAPRRVLVSAGLAAAFACLALVVSVGRAPSPFRARGGVLGAEAPLPSLAIYRVPHEPELERDHLRKTAAALERLVRENGGYAAPWTRRAAGARTRSPRAGNRATIWKS